ncbi:MAG: gliding motility lipoprotein GldH [Bacteroidales bacterium]|nr:gliding motility lipoprotein GldH [Bacteroidales bacterium]
MILLPTYYSKLRIWSNLFFVFALLIMFSSCDPQRIYEKNIQVNPNGWPAGEDVLFEVPVNDSLMLYNFYINLRHTENYKFSNLYLFIETHFPEGSQASDTIELILADNTGKWYGKGFGKIKEYQVLIRQAVTFPVTGIYNVSIVQGMREENLEGVEDIGIRIERMDQN